MLYPPPLILNTSSLPLILNALSPTTHFEYLLPTHILFPNSLYIPGYPFFACWIVYILIVDSPCIVSFISNGQPLFKSEAQTYSKYSCMTSSETPITWKPQILNRSPSQLTAKIFRAFSASTKAIRITFRFYNAERRLKEWWIFMLSAETMCLHCPSRFRGH